MALLDVFTGIWSDDKPHPLTSEVAWDTQPLDIVMFSRWPNAAAIVIIRAERQPI